MSGHMADDDSGSFRFIKWFQGRNTHVHKEAAAAPSPPRDLPGQIVHRVGRGDSVESIARKYGQDPQVIIEANSIKHPDNLAIGQLVVVPLTYTIKEGDTLTTLAKKFGSTVQELQEINGIRNPDRIRIGDVLVVPTAVKESSNMSH